MKRVTLSLLQAVIVLLGIATFVFLLWEPHFEGRNVDATLFEIYFKDPFLACVYASSTLFFVALYKAYALLGYSKRNELFSLKSVKALRTIRYCATILALLVVGAEVYLFIALRGKDDIAGGVAMGLLMIIVLSLVAISSAMFERHLQKNF